MRIFIGLKYHLKKRGKLITKLEYQPVITTRIYVLHKVTIALKFMSYINSDCQFPRKNYKPQASQNVLNNGLEAGTGCA